MIRGVRVELTQRRQAKAELEGAGESFERVEVIKSSTCQHGSKQNKMDEDGWIDDGLRAASNGKRDPLAGKGKDQGREERVSRGRPVA